MTEREARIAFNMIPTVGAVAVDRLARAAGGSVAEAYARFPEKRDWEGREPAWERELEQAAKSNVRILTAEDDDYPPLLLEIASPPLALYVVGEVSALSRAAVALIGTRGATAYGRDTAEKFACGLAQRGWCVLSGLARGVDTAAHRGALVGGGVTVGVLGGALDRFYPERNRDLAREIVANGGAVASQFPFGRPADEQTFPIRNHVVAALAQGVVAVECPQKSGTLITTGIAGDLGRPVMAVPGQVNSHMSAGCLDLIRNGAILVRNADDIIEVLSPLSPRKPAKEEPAPARDPEVPPYTVEESLVMLHVDAVGVSVDELVAKTGLPPRKVNSLAMELRLKGFVRFLPGNRIALPR